MKFPFYTLFFLLSILQFNANAQTLCSNAITITPGTQQCANSITNQGSLNSNPCSVFHNALEYWFQITGDGTNALQIQLSNLSIPNNALALNLFDECPNNSPQCLGVSIAFNDTQTSLNFTSSEALSNGIVYYVAIVTQNNNPFGFCMDASLVPPPAPPINDDCINAIEIPINLDYTCTTVVQASTQHATQSMPGCLGTADDDVWFKFTSPHNILYWDVSVSTSLNGIGSNLIFETFDQPGGNDQQCGSLTGVFCGGQFFPYGRMYVNPGFVRYIRVYSQRPHAEISFELCLKLPPPRPANDSCHNPIPLTQNLGFSCTNPVSGEYATMTNTFINVCTGSNAARDMWYSFVAQSTHVLVDINTDYFEPRGEIYSGSCAGLTSVACSDNNGEIIARGLTIGQTYIIRMWHGSLYTPGRTSFDICVYGLDVPNDICATAEPLPIAQDNCGTATAGHNFLASNSIDSLLPSCGSFSGNDVWYSLQAPSSGYIVVDANSTVHEHIEGALYAGDCNTLMEADCVQDSGNPYYFSGWPHRFQDLTPGTYYLRIWDNSNDEFGDFEICAYEPSPCRITDVSPGIQTCNPNGFTFNQELIITYPEEPPTGMLLINKLSGNPLTFPITGSPQTITLTNLSVDGFSRGVTAEFTDNVGCSWESQALFAAPRIADCFGLPQPGDNCGMYSSTNLVGVLGNSVGAVDSIVISTNPNEFIEDLNIFVDLRLSVQFYEVSVTSPSGTTIYLVDNECYFNDGLNVLFDDEANSFFECPFSYYTPYGNYAPNFGSLSAFDGEPLNGTWIINVIAQYQSETSGLLAGWCLQPNTVEQTSCLITGMTAGAQTTCDPQTNTYTQEITVTYSDEPTTGSLNVGGQFFSIGTSPQTVTLINLPATGAPVDMTAFFDDAPLCATEMIGLYTAPANCEPPLSASCGTYSSSPATPIDHTAVVSEDMTIPGMGSDLIVDLDVVLDIEHDRLQNLLITLTSPSGTSLDLLYYQCYNADLLVKFDDEAASTLSCQSPTTGIYQVSFGSLSDFDGEVFDGVWNLSITDYTSPYAGVLNQWCLVPTLAPNTSCIINNVTAGAQTACDQATKSYTQDLVVTYTDPPANGLLVVNGQEFAITGSPQTVTLTDLNGDGEGNEVYAYFDTDPFCNATFGDAFFAAPDCATVCGSYFYDTGGPLGNYSDDENDVYTFCPDFPGQVITATFFSFEIESDGQGGCYDQFFIYDGIGVTSTPLSPPSGYCQSGGSGGPSLQGKGLGGGPSPGLGVPINYPITSSDPSGCLTFHFVSDYIENHGGWEALITCSPPPSDIEVQLTLMLEGPYDVATSLMKDDLRIMDLIPLEEPFTGLGFPHIDLGGGETVDSTVFDVQGADAIVDWMMVELRDENDPTVVLATRSALIQADGDVVDVDGTSPVIFMNKPAGNYYVSVRPRHHLGVMTTTAIPLSRISTTTYDFKTGDAYGGSSGLKMMSDGVFALWQGDLNADGFIDAADRSEAWNGRNQSGYLQEDCSMNGVCDAEERSKVWNNRNLHTNIPGF